MMESLTEIWSNISNWLSMNITILTALSAIGALGAAIGAFLSAWATKKTGQAQLYSRFIEEYSSKDMLNGLRMLRKWKDDHGDGFEKKWLQALKKPDSAEHDVAYKVDVMSCSTS